MQSFNPVFPLRLNSNSSPEGSREASTWTSFSHRKTTSISLRTAADSRMEQNRWDFISYLISICRLQIRAWVTCGIVNCHEFRQTQVELIHSFVRSLHFIHSRSLNFRHSFESYTLQRSMQLEGMSEIHSFIHSFLWSVSFFILSFILSFFHSFFFSALTH